MRSFLQPLSLAFLISLFVYAYAHPNLIDIEPVRACVITRDTPLTTINRERLAQCLGWVDDDTNPLCHGEYTPIVVSERTQKAGIEVKADEVSLYSNARSELKGHVSVHQASRILNAETAYIYHDAKRKHISKIELLGNLHFIEPKRLIVAQKASYYPENKTGIIEDALYRFNLHRQGALLPIWGRSSLIESFADKSYQLKRATYTSCAPKQESWHVEASKIHLDTAADVGTATHAVLLVGDLPVLYSPYLTFPLTNKRKTGFLMPLFGYSNVGGFDMATPYYWNIAPGYDATITPHLYTRRGLMMGGNFRYLTPSSSGIFSGQVLPYDRAYADFIEDNQTRFPELKGKPTDRWSVLWHDSTILMANVSMRVNVQQVSDDYYLQDFSNNLAILTENQLLRQGDLTYTNDHWFLSGMLQSYQTLHPVNQVPISDIYERLPQLLAQGKYYDLPWGVNVDLNGQFDYFNWPSKTAPVYQLSLPEGSRYHANPILSRPFVRPWGFVTPALEAVDNAYEVHYGHPSSGSSFFNPQLSNDLNHQSFNRFIPRYSVDNGLFFDRTIGPFTQTLEPRVYYLYVPFRNQTPIPVYDSAYMIFNTDQLLRTNRFSGFDRISDTNQLSYALTTRLLSDDNGQEKLALTVGQIRYFADRRVQLCYSKEGDCVDSSLTVGYLSPVTDTSPIASHGIYHLNPIFSVTGDYVYDPLTGATNNGGLSLHYQPGPFQMLNVSYSYLVNGNLEPVPAGQNQDNALHQGTVSFATPLTEKWSTLGAYSYNISKGYSMMGLLGVQYDNCCWAARLFGGRVFKSLSLESVEPRYNTNIYFQVLLKGLGTVSTSDPASIIQTYWPGLKNIF